jgi:hypothetical protein
MKRETVFAESLRQYGHQLQQISGKRLVQETIHRPYAFVSPFDNQEFAALIIAQDPALAGEEQMAIAEALVAAGCRYAMGYGIDGSSWDTAVDLAFIHSDPSFHPPDERFVMTTWHDEDTPEEVASWLVWNTSFDFFVPENFLILNVGPEGLASAQVAEAAAKHLVELAAV